MRVALRFLLLALACLPLALASPGCKSGPKKLTGVHGRLLDKGGKLKIPANLPPGDPGVQLTFYPTDPKAQGQDPQQAVIDKGNVTFELPGNDQKGVPPGKYRVAISLGAYTASGSSDEFKGAFGPENSPIFKEITADNQDVTIDVTRDGGKPRS
jgi:hypothetical protein